MCSYSPNFKNKISNQKLNGKNNNLSSANKKFELSESEVNELKILNLLKTKKYFDTSSSNKQALNKFFQKFENHWGKEKYQFEN